MPRHVVALARLLLVAASLAPASPTGASPIYSPFDLFLSDDPDFFDVVDAGTPERAWLASLSRTLGGDVVEALAARAAAARVSSHLAAGGRSFALSGLASGDDAPEAAFSAWGRAVTARFVVPGERGAGAFTALAGADAAWGPWLAGVAFSVSEADGEDSTASPEPVSSALTGVYPYARVALTEALSAWGALGAGTGRADVGSDAFGVEQSDLDMRFAAFGARHALPTPAAASGATFALLGDVFAMRLRASPLSDAPRAGARATRARAALEGARPFALGAGASFTPSLAFGLRHDGRDEGSGLAAEVRAGAVYAAPLPGVRLDAHLRRPLADSAGAERWSLGAMLHIDPGVPGEGLSLSLAPAPAPSGPLAALEGLLGGGSRVRAERRLDAEVAYAGRAAHRFASTPYVGVALGGGASAPRLGWRVARGDASLGVEAVRGGAHAGMALRLRGVLRW